MSTRALGASDPLTAVRFVDVVLVVMALPFVAIAGLPLLGYAVGAGAWIVQRAVGELVDRRVRASGDVRTAMGLTAASLMARAWFCALAILAVGLAGEREDGLTAAVTVLAAFTAYFAMSLILRPLERSAPRR